MRVLIMGAAGMVGQKLLNRILFEESGIDNPSELYLHDIVPAHVPSGANGCSVLVGNVADPAEAKKLADLKPDLIFHLASIVSGEAELEFEKGWKINMSGAWSLLEALRVHHDQSGGSYRPKLIFTSSIAVFGAPFPARITDEFFCTPQTSYGAQKAIVESCCFLITAERALLMRFPFACPQFVFVPVSQIWQPLPFSLALSVNRLMVLRQFCQSAMMCVIGMLRPVLQRGF